MTDENIIAGKPARGAVLTLDTDALREILPENALLFIRDIAIEKIAEELKRKIAKLDVVKLADEFVGKTIENLLASKFYNGNSPSPLAQDLAKNAIEAAAVRYDFAGKISQAIANADVEGRVDRFIDRRTNNFDVVMNGRLKRFDDAIEEKLERFEETMKQRIAEIAREEFISVIRDVKNTI